MIPKETLEDLQTALLAEQAALEEELADHGKLEDNDWEGSSDSEDEEADPVDVADNIEELVTNVPMVEELKRRHKEIKVALQKMEDTTYGTCDVCGDDIPLAKTRSQSCSRNMRTTCR